MRPFGVCLRWTLLGLLLAVIVAFGAVLQQLLPAASALANLGLLRALVLPLASLALELGLLGGVPLGLALGVVRAGPARRDLTRLLVIPALVAAAVLFLSRKVDLDDDSPGHVVERLIAAARQGCPANGGDVPVPVARVTLHCSDGKLSGAAPIGGGTFRAAALVPSPDLSRLQLSRFELSLPARKGLPAVRVEAAEARVRGLRPWGRARSLPALRFWSVWLGVLASSAAVALLTMSQSRAGVRALFIAAGAGVAAVLSALALDRNPGAWELLLLPLSGVGAAIGAELVWDLGLALVAHFRTLRLRRQRAIARGAGRWYTRPRPEA